MTLSGQPKSQHLNMAHQFHNPSAAQNPQSTATQNQSNISNIFSGKSQRINSSSITAGPNSSAANHPMNISRGSNGSKVNQPGVAPASIEQYKTFSQKFNSRQSLGSQNATPIGAYAASFTHGNAGGQQAAGSGVGGGTGFSGVQHPKIISTGQMRQSVGHVNNLKSYTNKENLGDVQMRCNSGGPTQTGHQQQSTNSTGSQLASRHHHGQHHQIGKGSQNSSRGVGGGVHGRNYYPQQQSTQSIKQSGYQQQQSTMGSSSGIGPSLNYSQQSHNFNMNVIKGIGSLGQTQHPSLSSGNGNASKFGHHQQVGPQIQNRTSPQASFLRTAAMTNAFPNKSQINAQSQQQHYSSNKNVQCIGGGSGTPMSEITATANGIQSNLANTQIQSNLNSSQSMKQGGVSQQLGSRLSHPNGSGSISHGSKANLGATNEINLKLSQKSMKQGGALLGPHDSSQCSAAQSGSGSNRIPQPSIINSATGNMNQIIRQQSPKTADDPFKQVIEQNYHSQQQQQQNNAKVDKQQPRLREDEHEAAGGGPHAFNNNHQIAQEGSRSGVHQNVQAPMIIETKKFNLQGVTSNPSLLQHTNIQIAGQVNQRYGSRESTAGTTANNLNMSMMHSSKLSGNIKSFEQMSGGGTGQRTSSHSNNTSLGCQNNNVIKQRMRSNGTVGGNTTNATGQSRYTVGKNGTATATGIRNIEISSRLQEPFGKVVHGSGVSNNNSSFVIQNKYNNLHQKAHESNRASGGLVNSNINKSGQNLNNIHQRTIANKSHTSNGGNVPQTQRSGRGVNGVANTIGGTSGRSSLKHSHAGMTTNQPSHQKAQVRTFTKQQQVSSVIQTRQDEKNTSNKENHPIRSNKQASLSQAKTGSQLNQISKRNNTSENVSRQSIVAMQGVHGQKQRNANQQQNSSLGMVQRSQQSSNKPASNHTMMSNGHQKSKASTENEHTSSQGNASTSQRRNSSQHNTNRSQTAIQSTGASRTLQRLGDQVPGQQSKVAIQSSCPQPQSLQQQHDQSHQSNGSQLQQPTAVNTSHQASLLRRKSARDLSNNSKSAISSAPNQLEQPMVDKTQVSQKVHQTVGVVMTGAEKIEAQSQQVQGPTVLNGQQLQPQESKDEQMHIEKEEEETTMGEAAVAVEDEVANKNIEVNDGGPQPEAQQTAPTQMAQVPRTAFYEEQSQQQQQVQQQQQQQQLQLQPQNWPVAINNQESLSLTKPKFDTEKLKQIVVEMDLRRKEWLRQYKTDLDLNDVLEIRNPQSVIEFVPEILVNLKKEEVKHMYPSNFLDRGLQMEITDKYRQYLVDWLAELHYKFKMWPETLFVTVGIIDKTLLKWQKFRKADLQCLGITALHIAGKYEEIYPPELKTILQVIDNAVNRQQVCIMEADILARLDFDLVWPSILRFMQRYACISNFSNDQHMIAQMFCDFILLNTSLLQHKPSLLGAVAIYATNKITNRKYPWNASLRKCTLGIQEDDVKHLANELFYFVKTLENSSLKTMFRKYELHSYLGVVNVLQKIQMPAQSNGNAGNGGGATTNAVESTQAQSHIQTEDPAAPQPQEESR